MKFININKKPDFLLNNVITLKDELDDFKDNISKISEKLKIF